MDRSDSRRVDGVNEVLGTARWGKTVGKRFMGIRVVSVERLEPPGWWRALVRAVGLIPFGWSIRLGGPAGDAAEYGAMAPSPNQQALHDLYAGTIVVDDDSWRAYRARHAVHGP